MACVPVVPDSAAQATSNRTSKTERIRSGSGSSSKIMNPQMWPKHACGTVRQVYGIRRATTAPPALTKVPISLSSACSVRYLDPVVYPNFI
eukprot:CAMPEP_0172687528 /NCGR_PEP_ID=MMETSP1074-20121228/21749_1 /TAXON_ID=2916 /ORGANISM="Ceratium fusus, Strain PA161109" /LENGTH=90 /DNA_ID=CAMNT_0013506995 /DNA_START=41 /DNA_END=313 /DNA_ORIENTATION=+